MDAASDCKDAFVRLALQRYDWASLDGHFPDGSGLEVLKVVARCYPATRVILVTRHAADPVFRMRARELGAEGVFPKSASAAEILRGVEPAVPVPAARRAAETVGNAARTPALSIFEPEVERRAS